ncbi:hypothetical protein GGX14DRAFT_586763 [Mycena pura]|uniref:Uncharacterized protein n=1 Tax=Mycena pura TaxID=153505 RepID=A0AAD6XZR5_9AGAR|nr:hypothetical protein GGX14DRAFT_586763 [Mycena pura]
MSGTSTAPNQTFFGLLTVLQPLAAPFALIPTSLLASTHHTKLSPIILTFPEVERVRAHTSARTLARAFVYLTTRTWERFGMPSSLFRPPRCGVAHPTSPASSASSSRVRRSSPRLRRKRYLPARRVLQRPTCATPPPLYVHIPCCPGHLTILLPGVSSVHLSFFRCSPSCSPSAVASSPARSSSGSGGTEQIAITNNGMWVWRPKPVIFDAHIPEAEAGPKEDADQALELDPGAPYISHSSRRFLFLTSTSHSPPNRRQGHWRTQKTAHRRARVRERHFTTWLRASRWTASAFLFGRDVRSLTDPHTHSASGSSAAPTHAADPTNAFAAAFQGSQTVTTQRMCLGPALVARRILGQQARAPHRHHARVLDPILAEAVARASASTILNIGTAAGRDMMACLLTSPFTCSRSTREGIERDYTPTGAAPDIRRLPGDEVLAGAWQWLSVSACESNFPGFHKGGAEWRMTSGQATRWFGLKGVSSNCSENKAAPRTAAAAAVR